jgi:hypothetical protein
MALGADRIHLRGGPQVLPVERSVRIVTVRALDEAFFHLVMERLVELRLDVGVALEAELRLRYLEQRPCVFCNVNAVASDAAYVAFSVSRALEVGVLTLMAGETLRIHFPGCCFCGIEYLRGIPTAINVCLAGAVASLAGDPSLSVLLGKFGVRVTSEALGNLFMAGCAGLLTNEVARCGRCLTGTGIRSGWGTLSWGRSSRRGQAHDEQQSENYLQSRMSLWNRNDRQSHYWLVFLHQVPPWGSLVAAFGISLAAPDSY